MVCRFFFRLSSGLAANFLSAGLFLLLLLSCRGQFSDQPPIHPNPNMDLQNRKGPQTKPLEPPAGVVPFGKTASTAAPAWKKRADLLGADKAYYLGLNSPQADDFVAKIPIPVTMELMRRGRSRFNIFCATCHDRTGRSQAPIVTRGVGYPAPPQLSQQYLLEMKDGELFHVITYGRRNMPGYAKAIEVADRWAIVAYVRALQKARTLTVSELSQTQRQALQSQLAKEGQSASTNNALKN